MDEDKKPRFLVDRVSGRKRKQQYIRKFLKLNKKAINETNNEAFRAARREKKRIEREAKKEKERRVNGKF